MLRFVDQEQDDETLLAGMKRLPIGRMMKQAGREANDFYTRGQLPDLQGDNIQNT